MPLYYWTGIDLLGNEISGEIFALSDIDLDNKLLAKNISLINYKNKKINYKLSKQDQFYIINQLTELINAEIRLHEALSVVKNNLKNKNIINVLNSIYESVNSGCTLSFSIKKYDIFDELTKAVIISGEQSSNLKNSLNLLVDHEKFLEELNSNIKSGLFLPTLTLILFLIIAITLIVFIVPQFETLYQSFKEPLPNITQNILAISRAVRSFKFLIYLFSIALSILLITKLLCIKFKKEIDAIIFRFPFIGEFLKTIYRAKFWSLIHLMLNGKIHLKDSLNISMNTFTNLFVYDEINNIYSKVNSGNKLSISIEHSILDSEHINSLIKVGESSGNLDKVIKHAAILYQKKSYVFIKNTSSILGPALIILTGLFISFLILALYTPIINLSSVIP